LRHSRHILLLIVLLSGGLAVAFYLHAPKRPETAGLPNDEKAAPTAQTPEAKPTMAEPADESVEKSGQVAQDVPEKPPVQNFGRAVPVKADASPQAASVAEALRTKQHPERLSALIPGERYAPARKAEFLRTVGPSRVFDVAQPGRDVPALKAVGTTFYRLKQGESVKLAVKGAPDGVVSWTAFDMGEFAESKLNCVTVQADKEGVATVTFVAAPGALNDCNILAGSPMASGMTKFVVEISEAK